MKPVLRVQLITKTTIFEEFICSNCFTQHEQGSSFNKLCICSSLLHYTLTCIYFHIVPKGLFDEVCVLRTIKYILYSHSSAVQRTLPPSPPPYFVSLFGKTFFHHKISFQRHFFAFCDLRHLLYGIKQDLKLFKPNNETFFFFVKLLC